MSDVLDLSGFETTGFVRKLNRGGEVFACEVPQERGGGYVFAFTAKDGATTHLALSPEAFDAVVLMHDLLTKPQERTMKLLVELLDKAPDSDWKLVKKDPPPSERESE